MSTDPLMGEIAGPGSGPPLAGPGVTAPSLSGAGRRFLSDILVELGFVDETEAERAVEAARNPGQTPEKVLLESGAITEDQLARALAERYGLDHIDLTEFPVDDSAAALLRQTAAKRYLAAPVGFADDGALVLAVADPADSLGLSDIAVMTKLSVRPAVAARSQIAKLLDTLSFMQEPAPGAGQAVSTVIVPPDGDGAAKPSSSGAAEPIEPLESPAPAAGDDAERELARLREELALAIVGRDDLMDKLAALGEQSASAAEEEREEALSALRLEHERELAAAEAAAQEALRAERASAQQALSALRANHEEALGAERAKRVEEVEAERGRTAAAIDTERERNQKELEALRARLTDELEAARSETAATREELSAARSEAASTRQELEAAHTEGADLRAELEATSAELDAAWEQAGSTSPADAGRIEQLERELAAAREHVELTADADRRAEAARAALAALRDESERQAQVHALTERDLRAELDRVRDELEELREEIETLRALS
jgi:Type II secretion system (T2SS), protein E, N-terminal domain